jgi:hypothetical protein
LDKKFSVIEKMQNQIQAWEPVGDRRAIFLDCYARMTHNMLVAVQDQQFEDNRWVSHLLQRFADYYFNALEAFEHGPDASPAVWRIAFDAIQQPRTHALQHLILGVNAHINYDLVFTLCELLEPEWSALDANQRLVRYRDHCHVNQIIYQTIDSVQDEVIERYDPRMGMVDLLMGRMDEWLTSRLISHWREQVWQNTTALLRTPDGPARQYHIQRVEKHAIRRAHAILGVRNLNGLRNRVQDGKGRP